MAMLETMETGPAATLRGLSSLRREAGLRISWRGERMMGRSHGEGGGGRGVRGMPFFKTGTKIKSGQKILVKILTGVLHDLDFNFCFDSQFPNLKIPRFCLDSLRMLDDFHSSDPVAL